MDLIKKEYADKAVEACVTSFRVEDEYTTGLSGIGGGRVAG